VVTEPKIDEQYIKTGKVYYIAHMVGYDQQARDAFAAALCANDQGKYWEYSKVLFDNQSRFDRNSLAAYAQQIGLDAQAFTSCQSLGKHSQNAKDSTDMASAAGVKGTPSFFINGRLVIQAAQPFAEFQARIEEALKAGK